MCYPLLLEKNCPIENVMYFINQRKRNKILDEADLKKAS